MLSPRTVSGPLCLAVVALSACQSPGEESTSDGWATLDSIAGAHVDEMLYGPKLPLEVFYGL